MPLLFVTKLIKNESPGGYPFTVPAIEATEEVAFTAPVTVVCGENGSGKSTLLSLIAAKLNAVRIGQGIIEREQAVRNAQDAFTLQKRASRRNFFFSAEDFIAYVGWVSRTKAEAWGEIIRIDEDDSISDKQYAKMPYFRTLGDLAGLYAGNLAEQSHGEGFLDFFSSRIRPGGLYLLDEPEGALSYERQYALALMILQAAEESQFILATHSPILTAIPGAAIIEATAEGFLPRRYEDLDSIRFLKLFMESPQRMFR